MKNYFKMNEDELELYPNKEKMVKTVKGIGMGVLRILLITLLLALFYSIYYCVYKNRLISASALTFITIDLISTLYNNKILFYK